MRPGFQKNSSHSSPDPSIDGSFRKSESVASARTTSSTPRKFVPTSRKVYKVLKEFTSKLVDFKTFTEHLKDWVTENLYGKPDQHFSPPFTIDELRTFDFALEGILFQQLLRMPCQSYTSNHLKEDEFFALEDFLHTASEGLWHAFWHKSKPFPFSVSCPRYPGSKFYTVETAISRGRIQGLSGAALMAKNNGNSHWDDVATFVLFRQNILNGKEIGFSPSVVCEALFYAIHILLRRSLSKYNAVNSDSIFVSIIDSKFGGVVKVCGDLGKIEVDLSNPYKSITDWIKFCAEVSISPVDLIWNKLGNVNWGDFGTIQILLATFYSIIQWNGPPRKSMVSLASKHSLRLQKRRPENHESENVIVPNSEIVELDYENNQDLKRNGLSPGEVLVLESQKNELKSFIIRDFLEFGNGFSYIVSASENPSEFLNLFLGAHPSHSEPSWEDMNLWYQVQRQTKVLNLFKEHGISSKYLPEIIASGRITHTGPCKTLNGPCEHPLCRTPMLATCPVGEPISSIVGHNGPFSPQEATRCCRDCVSALRNAKMANIMHGDICLENIIQITNNQNALFVLVSWGRAVLEERDSPPLNLQFSSAHTLQNGKLCPSSDIESLVYLIYFVSGGTMERHDSIESAVKWRQRSWAKRVIQQWLGEVSPVLKAFADYVDSICGTSYVVEYDVWLRRLNKAVDGSTEKGKMSEVVLRLKDVPESSGTSRGGSSC